MPASTTPMNRPPTMLISVMMMPAMASPRTNLLAPSIAPKKSACCVISVRRRWASCSSIDAGVQVGVDRHLPARHAVQGEPRGHFADARGALGDDHELDDDDDHEDDQPDDDAVAGDELAEAADRRRRRRPARASRPCVRINRVVATLSTSRPSVVASSSEGKMLNSSGVRT